MKEYKFGEGSPSDKAELGDNIRLQDQSQEVVKCQETDVLMVNIDADELAKGDLVFIKRLGLTISNPDTDKPVALGVDFTEKTFGSRMKTWFESDNDDDDDFFYTPRRSSIPMFGGGSFGGFGGGFGGFGGGGFGGGGAGRGF
ncbi:MAG: hypothetical protein KJI69_05160 [Patescibacteria group bacterium]|nr:hypothetical protein [Patescibacteria group bacterium]